MPETIDMWNPTREGTHDTATRRARSLAAALSAALFASSAVVRAEPPVMAAEVAGSVSERALLDELFAGKAKLADQVEAHMSPPLPTIGATEGVQEAIEALETADALLVQEDGRPVGVLTRADLLTFIAAFR